MQKPAPPTTHKPHKNAAYKQYTNNNKQRPPAPTNPTRNRGPPPQSIPPETDKQRPTASSSRPHTQREPLTSNGKKMSNAPHKRKRKDTRTIPPIAKVSQPFPVNKTTAPSYQANNTKQQQQS